MIEVRQEEDIKNGQYIYTVIVPFKDLVDIDLDNIDRAVINSPAKSAADVLQNLQILTFRQQQQKDLLTKEKI